MSEWIKCSDLMPDDEVYVLFYQKYHKPYTGFRYGYLFIGIGVINAEPTHWVPLPVSPKD